jgi:N-acetylmuramoyl-L-alanine amidase
MSVHVVGQGECLSSIAARYGVTDPKALRNHPDNAWLGEKKRHPNVLAPGDQVTVPDPEERWVSCATEIRHKFAVPVVEARLGLTLKDRRGKPLGNKKFILSIGDDDTKGRTTSAGLLEAKVPIFATEARLRVWTKKDDGAPNVDRTVLIGHLDPIETTAGVQARLRNLGYRCTPTGAVDDATLRAAAAFRAAKGLPAVTEETEDDDAPPYAERLIDDALRGALCAGHEDL